MYGGVARIEDHVSWRTRCGMFPQKGGYLTSDAARGRTRVRFKGQVFASSDWT